MTAARTGSSANRRHRLEVRISEEQDALIREAAAIAGSTVSAFVLLTVADRAEQIIADSRDLVLSANAYDRFLQELDQPGEPVPELVSLFARHPSLGA